MKKLLTIFLAITMLLSASACGNKTEEPAAETPTEQTVTYKVETENYSDSCTYDDGTVIATCSFDMPRLHAYLADGTEVSDDLVASQPSEIASKALSVVTAFNAEMDNQLASKQTFVKEMFDWAKEGYEFSLEWEETWFEPYTEEETFTVYQTDNLVSVCMQFYDYLGGAHPNSGYDTYNFDLTTGEMVTYADFVKDDAEFRRIVSDEILQEIQKQGIADGLFEDYDAYVRDLAYADDCYDDNGITFIFEEYSIGPHAAGCLMFDIPYGMIANILNERGTALLPIGQEDIVLADFYDTRELWSYFSVCTMPTDSDSAIISDGGYDYQRVDCKGITTMQQLRDLLLVHVSDDVAEEWLESGTYREFNGVLYACGAGRGTNIELGDSTYSVEMMADSGTVIESTEHYDLTKYDEETHNFTVDDYVVTGYPFVLKDGHAVFSTFNCPL